MSEMFGILSLFYIFLKSYVSSEVSGARIKYASSLGLRNTQLPMFVLWTKPMRSETPQADCGLTCFMDSKCVSYDFNNHESTCKGYSQTLFEDSVSGTNPSLHFFYSDCCGKPSDIFEADIIEGTVKDRYMTGDVLRLKCRDIEKKFNSTCGNQGQWMTDIKVCQDNQGTTISSVATNGIITVAPQASVNVPSGFLIALNGSLIYSVDPVKADYNLALFTCVASGSRMIQVKDNETMEFIKELARTAGRCIWINGRNDRGTWMFNDGLPIETFFWGDGEPNAKNGQEDCLNVMENRGDYMWNDCNCDYKECQIVCQYK